MHRYWLTGRAPPGVPTTIPPPGVLPGGTSPGYPGALPLPLLFPLFFRHLPSSSMYYSQKNRLANSIMYHLSFFLPFTTYTLLIVYSPSLYCILIPSYAYSFHHSHLDTLLPACLCTLPHRLPPAPSSPAQAQPFPLFHPSSPSSSSGNPCISLLSWHLKRKSKKISKRDLTRAIVCVIIQPSAKHEQMCV